MRELESSSDQARRFSEELERDGGCPGLATPRSCDHPHRPTAGSGLAIAFRRWVSCRRWRANVRFKIRRGAWTALLFIPWVAAALAAEIGR
jgi:hypothetical protein